MISNAGLAHFLSLHIPPTDYPASARLKDERSRATLFVDWLALREPSISAALLLEYRSYLATERALQASSLRAHLASLRGWLRTLLQDDAVRQELTRLLEVNNGEAEREVSSLYNRLWEAIDPRMTRVTRPKHDPTRDFCPTVGQIGVLLEELSIETLPQLRDTTIIGYLALLGLRQTEVAALNVEDLAWNVRDGGHITIPDRPGCIARTIPMEGFGALGRLTQRWMGKAQITEGPLFRGFHRNAVVRPQRMSPRSIQQILKAKPIRRDGEEHSLKPLELRRFAARLLVRQGYSLDAMGRLLGVAQTQTVLDYLGGDLPRNSGQGARDLDRLSQALLRKLP